MNHRRILVVFSLRKTFTVVFIIFLLEFFVNRKIYRNFADTLNTISIKCNTKTNGKNCNIR